MEYIDAFIFLMYRVTFWIVGIAFVCGAVCASVRWALCKILDVATLIEAAHEARDQGRAPLLRAWLRIGE